MEDYQKRVLIEQEEISKKIVALTKFVTDLNKTKDLSEQDFRLLRSQLESMLNYDYVLQMRLLQVDISMSVNKGDLT